jgi:hypothetical protein
MFSTFVPVMTCTRPPPSTKNAVSPMRSPGVEPVERGGDVVGV